MLLEFASAGVVLAIVGVYDVLAQTARRRTREMGGLGSPSVCDAGRRERQLPYYTCRRQSLDHPAAGQAEKCERTTLNPFTIGAIVAVIFFATAMAAERHRTTERSIDARAVGRSLFLGVFGRRRDDYSIQGWRLVLVARVLLILLFLLFAYVFLNPGST
jgi:hypothetical protein